MQSVLLIIHLFIAGALVAVVLLQRSEGGALGIGGGGGAGGGFLTGRGQANLLTRITAALGAAFFVTSIALTILARQSAPTGSAFDRAPAAGTTAPAKDAAPAAPAGTPPATTPPATAPTAPAAPPAKDAPRGGILDKL